MLLCVVKGAAGGLQESVEAAGDMAFEGADRFAAGFALADAPLDVGLGLGVCAGSGEGDAVDGVVECPVAAAVEAVAVGGAAGCWDWGDAGEAGEARFASEASGV